MQLFSPIVEFNVFIQVIQLQLHTLFEHIYLY